MTTNSCTRKTLLGDWPCLDMTLTFNHHLYECPSSWEIRTWNYNWIKIGKYTFDKKYFVLLSLWWWWHVKMGECFFHHIHQFVCHLKISIGPEQRKSYNFTDRRSKTIIHVNIVSAKLYRKLVLRGDGSNL